MSCFVYVLHSTDAPIISKTQVTEVLVNFTDNTYSNGQIEIPCIVDGNPSPAIYWYKDGQNITQHYRVTDRRLYMEGHVVNELLGVYQCFAENTAGTAYIITRALLNGKKHCL